MPGFKTAGSNEPVAVSAAAGFFFDGGDVFVGLAPDDGLGSVVVVADGGAAPGAGGFFAVADPVGVDRGVEAFVHAAQVECVERRGGLEEDCFGDLALPRVGSNCHLVDGEHDGFGLLVGDLAGGERGGGVGVALG